MIKQCQDCGSLIGGIKTRKYCLHCQEKHRQASHRLSAKRCYYKKKNIAKINQVIQYGHVGMVTAHKSDCCLAEYVVTKTKFDPETGFDKILAQKCTKCGKPCDVVITVSF